MQYFSQNFETSGKKIGVAVDFQEERINLSFLNSSFHNYEFIWLQ